ncbi:MAG: NADH-quinone oxidoreductase subunit N [Phycisphaerae bacterium]
MTSLVSLLLPELVLIVAAALLFMVGLSNKAGARRAAPWVAMVALLAVFLIQWSRVGVREGGTAGTQYDSLGGFPAGTTAGAAYGTVRAFEFAEYVKLIVAGVGAMLVLLAWPTNRDSTGNTALQFEQDAGEFFGLMLLSLAGASLVAGANDIMLLFLGIEMASIPTYVMVSLSRRAPVAQEAGVKYFFLGAMAAAVMLFGFSYLYGTTGSTNLYEIGQKIRAGVGVTEAPVLNPWQTLAVLMLVAGFAFKMAAATLHFYAGDVYQGAATPVTAFLSFVPKATGFVALVKLLFALGGSAWALPEPLVKANGTGLLFVLAIITMTVGNVLGLLQYNVKRTLAYSSVAHTGYMLVALAALGVGPADRRGDALMAVLFYLAAYGVMNVGAFGVLMLLPGRDGKNSAETFEDIAGHGRRHVPLALAMSICCFSLIGLPLTVGFIGKVMLIKPALGAATGGGAASTAMTWLVVITVVNAAVSAAYYLKIVAHLFLRGEDVHLQAGHAIVEPAGAHAVHEHPETHPHSGGLLGGPHILEAHPYPPGAERGPLPILLAVALSVGGVLMLGMVPPAIELMGARAKSATLIEAAVTGGAPSGTRAAPVPASPASAALGR